MANACPMRRSRHLMVIAAASAALAWGAAPASAGQPSPPQATQLVRDALHDAFAAFSGPGKLHTDKERLAEDLVRRYADLGRISSTILGPYWAQATPDQQQKFTALLVDYGLSVWARPMTGAADSEQKVSVKDATPAGDDVVVHTFLNASGRHVPIDWTVSGDPGGRPVITDVTADNVSFIHTMRDDFTSYLHHHHDAGLAGLMQAMQAKIDRNVASAAD